MRRPLMLGAGILGLSGAAALAAMSIMGPRDPFGPCRITTVAEDIGGPFVLIDESGREVTDTDLITWPTLIYFGYSFCPDVCPLDNARNVGAMERAAEAGVALQPVFITVDPMRDTPDALAEFTDFFHPDLVGLTGTPFQIAEVAAAFRVFYDIRDENDPEYYLVDHSTFSYLMLPGHGFVDIVMRDESAASVARRAACFVDRAT